MKAALSTSEKSVLVVDDDQCSRERVTAWFVRRGWRVRAATNYDEGLVVASSHFPSHVIAEQQAGSMSAVAFLQRLRQIVQTVDGVVVTGYPSVAGAVGAIQGGYRDYLPKPVSLWAIALLFDIPGDLDGAGADAVQERAEELSLARIEWEHIHTVLARSRGNVSLAARSLRIPRRSLQRKLRRIAPP